MWQKASRISCSQVAKSRQHKHLQRALKVHCVEFNVAVFILVKASNASHGHIVHGMYKNVHSSRVFLAVSYHISKQEWRRHYHCSYCSSLANSRGVGGVKESCNLKYNPFMSLFPLKISKCFTPKLQNFQNAALHCRASWLQLSGLMINKSVSPSLFLDTNSLLRDVHTVTLWPTGYQMKNTQSPLVSDRNRDENKNRTHINRICPHLFGSPTSKVFQSLECRPLDRLSMTRAHGNMSTAEQLSRAEQSVVFRLKVEGEQVRRGASLLMVPPWKLQDADLSAYLSGKPAKWAGVQRGRSNAHAVLLRRSRLAGVKFPFFSLTTYLVLCCFFFPTLWAKVF